MNDDFIPLVQPRTPSFSPTISEMAAHIRRRNDEVVLKALQRIDPVCTVESLGSRLHAQVAASGVTYYLDGKAFVWVGAPKIMHDETTGTISVDREWKELP